MSEKEIAQIEDTLIQARKKGLLKASDTTMHSHGKLWGMDVFSWIHPNPAVLTATMNSFPFPVIWVSSSLEKESIKELTPNGLQNVYYSIELAPNQNEIISEENNHILVNSVSKAFEVIQSIKIKPSILLFTYANSDWEFQRNSFKEYLSLAQAK